MKHSASSKMAIISIFPLSGNVIPADTILRTGFRSLASQLTSTEEQSEGLEAMAIDSDNGIDATTNPAESAFQERILATICDEYIYNSKTEVST